MTEIKIKNTLGFDKSDIGSEIGLGTTVIVREGEAALDAKACVIGQIKDVAEEEVTVELWRDIRRLSSDGENFILLSF